MKNIHLLGATGSIGTQTLDVIRNNRDRFRLTTLSFHSRLEEGLKIIEEFKPLYVSVGTKEMAEVIRSRYPQIEVNYGPQSLVEAAVYDNEPKGITTVVTALVGSIGLVPTVEAIKKGYQIALANKETLVTAGHLVMELAKKHQVPLLPVDSEHSAIFQALQSGKEKEVKRLIITASGGSFRDKSREELTHVTVQDALKHPNWTMGAKITIDSATMMNKGFEVIEAHHLFNVPFETIDTLLHRESVIHSLVEFVDTSVMAQLGTPDMRLPIQYALTFPDRLTLVGSETLDLSKISTLHFQPMDFDRYPLLKYAYEAGTQGGSLPCVLNSSNDAAVRLFLEGKIGFLEIEKIVYNELMGHNLMLSPNLNTLLELDQEIKERILHDHGERS